MSVENVKPDTEHSTKGASPLPDEYDPFVRGRFPVGVRTIEALDTARGRLFPCEVWYPAAAQHAGQDLAPDTQDFFTIPSIEMPRSQMAVRDAAARPGNYPLIIFSHGSSRGARRMSTFLCTHLSSHGYVVAALNHFELVAVELAPRAGETAEEKTARAEAVISNRVPDIQFLIDYLLNGEALKMELGLEPAEVGIVGYSFGGWTALEAAGVERRIKAVVALAPAGSSNPRPGIAPVKLGFDWRRDIPTLYLAGENDNMTPLDGMHELFARTPATKQMFILRRADHMHFLDNVEQEHEHTRSMSWPGDLAWIPKEMRPITELCSGDKANLFVRGLTLCHMDAALRRREEAQRFLAANVEAELAARGIDAIVYEP
jgi:predicted dienelactone hydrolase